MVLYPQARLAVEASALEPPIFDPGFDIAAARTRARVLALGQPRVDVAVVRDLDADGVPCRLYIPQDAMDGVVVHLHGGGFVFNDVDVHDAAVRQFANCAGIAVLSVDYRRPPERRTRRRRTTSTRCCVWLDSACRQPRGRRSDVCARRQRWRQPRSGRGAAQPGSVAGGRPDLPLPGPGLPGFRRTQRRSPVASTLARQPGTGGSTPAATRSLRHPDLAPLLSDGLHTLPPTMIVTAEHDPLRDEGEHLAAAARRTVRRGGGQLGNWARSTGSGGTLASSMPPSRPCVPSAGFLRQHHL